MEEFDSSIMDVLNSFAKTEEFQRLVELFSSIPDDVHKTVFYQKCERLSKTNLAYEEVEWLFDEIGIANKEEADVMIQKYVDRDDIIHSYIVDVMKNNHINNREKLIIVLCHFERLINSTLKHEKKHNETAKDIFKSELKKNNHGMDNENLYRTVLLAITNVVFANTNSFNNIDRRLPFRNNILHKGIVDYSDKEVDIAYDILSRFAACIMRMSKYIT